MFINKSAQTFLQTKKPAIAGLSFHSAYYLLFYKPDRMPIGQAERINSPW